jgi:hypothetical protein
MYSVHTLLSPPPPRPAIHRAVKVVEIFAFFMLVTEKQYLLSICVGNNALYSAVMVRCCLELSKHQQCCLNPFLAIAEEHLLEYTCRPVMNLTLNNIYCSPLKAKSATRGGGGGGGSMNRQSQNFLSLKRPNQP